MLKKIANSFFLQDVLLVTPSLLGKYICRRFDDGKIKRYMITEVEAYRGEEDLACHARCGKTKRNSVMYETGGKIYVYLIYGMYFLLNIVTSKKNDPQAVLIRGFDGISGPGRVGRELKLDKSFYGEDISESSRLWVEDSNGIENFEVIQTTRIGVNYAGEWAKKRWRWVAKIQK